MALDINTGYNSVFKSFVDFAQQRVNANDAKAIADAKIQRPLGGRRIVAVTQSLTDSVHNWTRNNDQFIVNDRTRKLFRNAIIDMFGGESKIPASVKKAMLMADYNAGKPLTARRIMAVKQAIDADGTAKARAKLENFASPEVAEEAIKMGFTKAELPKLARTAHFYAQATGKTEMEAMKEVATPGTDANRLAGYGGRFLENAENFTHGLRLIKDFAGWYQDLKAGYKAREDGDFSQADTPSKLNAHIGLFTSNCLKGMEKFIFEDLATNPKANLAETDKEKLFGFENNAASRFFGRDFGNGCSSTIANIPPAKRQVVYASYDLFCRMATNPEETKTTNRKQRMLLLGERSQFLARIMKNFDQLEALHAKGKLTAKKLIQTCFPDLKDQTGYNLQALRRHFKDVNSEMGENYSDIQGPVQLMIEATGCTVEEAGKALRGTGPFPTPPKYMSGSQVPLEDFDGTTQGGRSALKGDLYRPQDYSFASDGIDLLKGNDNIGFGFNFPGEGRFVTNGSQEGRANIAKVGDKVEAMCGKCHAQQASSVMFMLSQSGLSPINRGLKAFGINSTEHSAVDYTLSKDAKTGAVTIKYESPKELPFKFEWTATVDIDGNVKTTPLKFDKFSESALNSTKPLVADAAAKLNVQLTNEQTNKAVALLAEFQRGLPEKSTQLLAQFIVNLKLNDKSAAGDRDHVADMAQSISKWREFGPGESNMPELESAIRDVINDEIQEMAKPERQKLYFLQADKNIHITLHADANRATYIINGVTCEQTQESVIGAFKKALPDPKAQKAISSFLHQNSSMNVNYPANHVPYDTRNIPSVDGSKLPGADGLVNRDYTSGMYNAMINGKGHATYTLDVAPDGKSATITIKDDNAMTQGYGPGGRSMAVFGRYTITQHVTIDLTPEIPTVTDVKLSQSFSAEI